MQTFTDDELKDAIEQETGIRPPFAMGAFTNLEDSVRESIARLEASFVYDVETGGLREVGR